jgi:hypothetical protein
MRTDRTTCLALLVAACALPARAQPPKTAAVVIGSSIAYIGLSPAAIHHLRESAGPPSVGADVQVVSSTPMSSLRQRGRLLALDADGVTIMVGRTPTRIARRDVRSISVYSGTEGKWAEGWRAGLIGGGSAGALLGFAAGGSHGGDDRTYSAAEGALILAIAGAVSASIGGAAIGAMREGDHWEPVRRIPWSAAVTAMPRPNRAILIGLAIDF